MKAKYASTESTHRYSKIDASTWEYATSETLFQPSAGDAVGSMRFLLEQIVKNASTRGCRK